MNKKQYTLNITQNILNNSGKSAHNCPVANAVRPFFPERDIIVNTVLTMIDEKEGFIEYELQISGVNILLPRSVSEKLTKYDNGVKLIPFEFIIDLPVFDS